MADEQSKSRTPVRALCPHAGCGKRLTRFGRGDWRCPVHGDVMLLLVWIFIAEQGEKVGGHDLE